MNAELKKNKAIIRSFMVANYTDAKLAQLLDHARAGKLAYVSCCCFIGVATADHELKLAHPRTYEVESQWKHYVNARWLQGSSDAEAAYRDLNDQDEMSDADLLRRLRLIPMILAEIRRRRIAQPEAAEALKRACELSEAK